MKLLYKLERKYKKFAIHNLMLYIIFGNAAVYLLGVFSPGLYQQLVFSREAIMSGQVWRLLTFVFIPPSTSPIFIVFVLYFYYIIGSALEQEWGAFRFNAYYLIGVMMTIIPGFAFGSVMSATYINLSLFMAFATLYPNFTIRLFFILPLKIKYLAYFNAAFFLFSVIAYPLNMKLMAIAGIVNYLLFFGEDLIRMAKGLQKKAIHTNKKKTYKTESKIIRPSFHKCNVCGKTEIDYPNLEFRYCSKCDGYKEYCMDHLFDHEHIEPKER